MLGIIFNKTLIVCLDKIFNRKWNVLEEFKMILTKFSVWIIFWIRTTNARWDDEVMLGYGGLELLVQWRRGSHAKLTL